ncbi:polysaccharide pyruvyl transferase family protein [Priestia megaterium]|uniref:polysaccharide pyruvyl transferase family protein n=1 Tax=Priestia megaterium TaxID=1404 RepID=UPI002813F5E1|nr:polysaccharide pyruvyl transferase family protein [Priestia megaterium]MDR0127787.1 polysaccharide pyruvyl transferase family protein [Priestia megaterium]
MSQNIDLLKKKIPFKWKMYMRYYLSEKVELPISKSKPKVIVTLAANYGNLGDVAITKAQVKFIEDLFPGHELIKIHVDELNSKLIPLRRIVNSNDIITIIGGGNMGDLYEFFEEYRRTIIDLFPNNKIVSFPQTFDFSESSKGQVSLSKSIKIYSKHSNLHVFSREPLSYRRMQESFKNNSVYMVPDIVLYLDNVDPQHNRTGVTLCLRDDKEKKISNDDKEQLLDLIKEKYKDIKYYDTHIGDENFEKESADIELDKIWNNFKKSKVVVTDRLHGMIFCAITRTPCLVLPNSNHKIAGTYYQWLSDLKYIRFIEKYDERLIIDSIDELYNIDVTSSEKLNLREKYEPLLEALKD